MRLAPLVVPLLIPLIAAARPAAPSAQGLTVVERLWVKPLWGSVGGLGWTPDGSALVAGTGTGSVFSISPEGVGLWTRGVGSTVTALSLSGGTILVGTDSGILAAYDESGGISWSADLGIPVYSLVPVPGGWIAAAGGDLLYARNGSVAPVGVNLSFPPRIVSGCGGRLVAAGPGAAAIIDLPNMTVSLTVDLPGAASSLACGPSGVALGDDEGMLTVVEGNSTLSFDLGVGIEALSWSPGDLLAAGLADGRVVVLTPTGEVVWNSTSPSPVTTLAWDPSGSLLAVGTSSGWFYVYTGAGTESHRVDLGDRVCSLSWSPDGSLLAVGTWDVHLFAVSRPGFRLEVSPSPDGSALEVLVSVSPPLPSPLEAVVSAVEGGVEVARGPVLISGGGGTAGLNLTLPPGDHALAVRLLVSGKEAASRVVEVSVPPSVSGAASWSRGRLRVNLTVVGGPLSGRLEVSESGRTLARVDLNLPEGNSPLEVPLELPPGDHRLSVAVTGRWGGLWEGEVSAAVRGFSVLASPSGEGGALSVTVSADPPPSPGETLNLTLRLSEGGVEVWVGRVSLSGPSSHLEVPLELPPGDHSILVEAVSGGEVVASTRVEIRAPGGPQILPYAGLVAAAAVGAAAFRLRRRSTDAELKLRILEEALSGRDLTPELVASRLGISRSRAARLLEELREEGSLEG